MVWRWIVNKKCINCSEKSVFIALVPSFFQCIWLLNLYLTEQYLRVLSVSKNVDLVNDWSLDVETCTSLSMIYAHFIAWPQVWCYRYMRGRLTLEKVNAAINDMVSYAEANAQLIVAPKKKVNAQILFLILNYFCCTLPLSWQFFFLVHEVGRKSLGKSPGEWNLYFHFNYFLIKRFSLWSCFFVVIYQFMPKEKGSQLS